ncbi:MAG TPA: hypothetical protein VFZ91_05800 [Allosphingosinicella sp.]
MDFLNYLFSAAAWWIWLLVAAAIGFLVYLNRHSFGVTDFFYTFPVVGRLARFSNDYSVSTKAKGWLNVENTLCRDYAKHCTAMSREEYDNNILYLKKTYDHGRREIPMWVLGLLAVLIILEGLGFSYLLGGFMAMEGSENTRQILMVAIVLVLATILVWVTHHAGHQWFRTSLLRHCFREYQKDKRENRCFTSQIVSLDEDQRIDDDMPGHVQCANRVVSKPGDLGSHAWVWIAGLLIFTIAIGSTVLRLETLHTAQIEEQQAAAPIAGAEDLPPEVAAEVGGAPSAAPATDPAAASKENAALAGFIMLAIIFVVTQLVGVGVGLRYGFAGKQSRLAHRATQGHADYSSYFAPIEQRMMIANSRLLKLHQLLERHSPTPIDFEKDFFIFIKEERKRGATYLQEPPEERAWGAARSQRKAGNGHDDPAERGEIEPIESAVNGGGAGAAGSEDAPKDADPA